MCGICCSLLSIVGDFGRILPGNLGRASQLSLGTHKDLKIQRCQIGKDTGNVILKRGRKLLKLHAEESRV